jgi:hypothetical protein
LIRCGTILALKALLAKSWLYLTSLRTAIYSGIGAAVGALETGGKLQRGEKLGFSDAVNLLPILQYAHGGSVGAFLKNNRAVNGQLKNWGKMDVVASNFGASRRASLGDILDDVDKWSLRPVSNRQKQMITDKLSAVKQRSKDLTQAVRKGGFSQSDQKRLIQQWENETGHSWPSGATPHHIIPLKNGGSNEWWNLTPVKNPHQGTIHGSGSALRNELPYSIEPGTITELK